MDQKAIVNFLVSVAEKRMYVEFVQRCTLQSFLDCHKHAFHYLGGVPAEVLYDNIEYVVIRRDIGQVDFNIELLHFAHHCGFTPKACSSLQPLGEGQGGTSRRLHSRELLARLRVQLDRAGEPGLSAWLDTVANTRVHGTHRQPIAELWQQEKASLRMLPPSEYDTSLKIFRYVRKHGLIRFDANLYKLPHAAVGKKILLKIKDGTIRFFDGHRLLASYPQAVGMYQLRGQSTVHRYERSSTIITSNRSFTNWQELFGDAVIATAILDRLLHHCKVVNIKGHSYRFSQTSPRSL